MITLDAIRAAVQAPDPYTQMDNLIRAEMSAGRKVKEIFDGINPLIDTVLDTPGLTEDGEEAFLGTLDALTGNCHRDQCYYDPPNTSLPTEEEIAALPRWARVAFAARCARRVLPLYKHFWPDAPDEHVAEVVGDVEAAERYARVATQAIDFDDAVVAAIEARLAGSQAAGVVARAVARAIQSARVDPVRGDNARIAAEAAAVAAEAAGITPIGTDIRPSVRRDFDRLVRLAASQHWTDKTPVPAEVFGPLWPDGPPSGWPVDSETLVGTPQPDPLSHEDASSPVAPDEAGRRG